ncbi:protein EMBRYO DEFECTIVE 514-like [Abrus precatorius]|uniref:Protein EMBRYO DEFECTIVE 514-like n=1 Tax=Abrus precatorius TaxID=3816 RepID=A0A8B8K5E8_ABRPR|nr:protein EMBRYO DEFECTIVE 514-like [Abrus precatorius]
MAEEAAPEVIDPNTPVATVDMDVESAENGADPNPKRAREEEDSHDDDVSKKQKVDDDKSVEEQRLEKLEQTEEEKLKEEEGKEECDSVKLGPKSFGSSTEMFNYFYNFLHAWPQYLNVNKYEYIMLLELLKKGHAEPEKKIGGDIRAFQIRKHPTFKSMCFFLIREDGSVDDFSFRKCVDHILPLPEEMHLKSDANRALSGGGGKHYGGKGGRGKSGRGGGHGHGKGGRWRH